MLTKLSVRVSALSSHHGTLHAAGTGESQASVRPSSALTTRHWVQLLQNQ